MVSARLNQLLVLMSDSVIGFPNQVAFCPWLKLDVSSTRLPGPPSLETTPSLPMTSMVDQNKHYSDHTAKGPWCFIDRRQSDQTFRSFFLLRKALIDFTKHTHRNWYHPVGRMHTGTLGKKYLREDAPVYVFSHSDTNWSTKKGTFERKMFFSKHFEACPCNKSVIALVLR